MKVTNALLILQVASAELVHLGSSSSSSVLHTSADTSEEKRVGIFYSTQRDQRTPVVANVIAGIKGLTATNVADTDGQFDFSEFDSIIVGAPTYNTDGADHRSETEWDDWLYDVLPNIDVNGKNIAIFATGKGWYEKTKTHDDGTTYTTQSGYGDNFGDVMGELYDRFSEAGATMFGFTDGGESAREEYNFDKSKAIRNGQFMGKMFDGKSQADENWARATSWVEQLETEGFF